MIKLEQLLVNMDRVINHMKEFADEGKERAAAINEGKFLVYFNLLTHMGVNIIYHIEFSESHIPYVVIDALKI